MSAAGFVDAAPHRAALAPIYNQYTRVAADPAYARGHEAESALFRPLFTTAFLLADNGFFGGHVVLPSSASSKTARGRPRARAVARRRCPAV